MPENPVSLISFRTAQFGIQTAGIRYIVTVYASAPSLKNGRGIYIGYAQLLYIRNELFSLRETEGGIEL